MELMLENCLRLPYGYFCQLFGLRTTFSITYLPFSQKNKKKKKDWTHPYYIRDFPRVIFAPSQSDQVVFWGGNYFENVILCRLTVTYTNKRQIYLYIHFFFINISAFFLIYLQRNSRYHLNLMDDLKKKRKRKQIYNH